MSQPDTITLAVDTGNTGTTTDTVFSEYDRTANARTYMTDEHLPASVDLMILRRNQIGASGNNPGSLVSYLQFKKDQTIEGVDGTDVVQTATVSVEMKFPLGTTQAEMLLLRQRLIAALDNDTIMTPLNNQLMI